MRYNFSKIVVGIYFLGLLHPTDSFAVNYSGQFAFDWFNSTKSKCKKIDGNFNKKLLKMKCSSSSENFGGEDKPASFSCKDKKAKTEFLIYTTFKDCNLARETTLANGT